METTLFILVGFIGLGFGLFSFWQSVQTRSYLIEREKEIGRRVYELAILKELGERIGYSLNIEQIVDVITGSLKQFIQYAAVSYMLVEPEKIIFKVNLERSVDRKFVDDVKVRMINSLSALLNKDLTATRVEEILAGAILVEDIKNPVRSYFNIPVVIGDKVEGIVTIAHVEMGLYKEEEMTILYRIMNQASTALTKLQEVVRAEERKLSAMVQSLGEGVVMTDNDYRILVANQVARSIISYDSPNDITIFDFINKLEGKFDIRGKLEESIKLDKVVGLPEVLIGDKFFQILVSPVRVKDSLNSESVIGGVVIFHDITHEKEVEKLKEDFTSMMVHELRSPLDGIKKRIEVLQEAGGNTDKKYQDDLMKTVYKNASHMLELVNDLLDAAKLEAGKFELRKEPTDVKNIIKDRVTFFEILAKDGNINISSHLAADVPEKIMCDSMRIEQILNNLISNAVKFTNPGGKIVIDAFVHKFGGDLLAESSANGVQWQVKASPKNINLWPESVVIAVTDSGVGISEKNQAQLFNKFKQFRDTAINKEKAGTGLGLAIAKGIAEGHGGTINVASTEGAGSTFYVNIPII